MPCYDERSSADWKWTNWKWTNEWKPRLDAATRAACEAMTALENEHITGVVSPESQAWWEAHKEQDRRRLRREREEAERKEAKERARAKLTKQERKLLGLK